MLNSRPLTRESGQTLALFALMLPVIIGMAGLGVDASNVYLHFRNAQSAADLGALAGARLLPHSPTATDYTTAENRAMSVAGSNGYSSGVTANAPYVDGAGQTHGDEVEVIITSAVPTYFLPLLGISSMDVNVRAVAGSAWTASGGTFPAVFAGCTNISECGDYWDPDKAIDWPGSDGLIIGGMHSNCGISAGGQRDEVQGSTTYSGTCPFNDGGNTFSSAGPGPHQDFPVDYTASTFTCTETRPGKLELKDFYESTSPRVIRPGVYCATGPSAEIVLGEDDVTGNVTLVVDRGTESCATGAPEGKGIYISGQRFQLTAYHSTKVVMYSNVRKPPAIEISGSDGTWNGLIVARCGHVVISGQSNSTVGGGSILANTVYIGGSDVSIDSNGLSTLGPATLDHLRLYE